MKIVVVTSAFPILSETFVLNQVTGLIDRGHEVHILASRIGDGAVVHPDVERYGLLSRVSLLGDGYARMPRAKLPRLARAAAHLVGRGRTRPLGRLLRTLNVFRYGKDAATLNLFYRARHLPPEVDDADVLLCHFGHMGEAMARLADAGFVDAPIATAFHGHDLSRDLMASRRSPYRFLFARGGLFLPVSAHWRETLERHGCEPSRIAVHRMGIDTAAIARRTAERNGGRLVLSVARFVEKKGLEDGIAAFGRVAERFPDARYHLIGEGPLHERLAARIRSLGLDDRVELLPPRDADGIVAALGEARLFLLPSVTASDGDKEGVPVVLMEAMAAGLPVLSTVHSGIPELVGDGESGYLVAEGDVAALAERLERLLEDDELVATMGEAGREKVRREFDIESLNDTLAERLAALARDVRSGSTGGPDG